MTDDQQDTLATLEAMLETANAEYGRLEDAAECARDAAIAARQSQARLEFDALIAGAKAEALTEAVAAYRTTIAS